jgi:hypothetical protein
MTQPLSRTDLVALQQETIRREWLRRLRTEGRRQCVGLHKQKYDVVALVESDARQSIIHAVCAIGLLGEIIHGPRWWERVERDRRINLLSIGAAAGLSPEQVQLVVVMNDGEVRFGTMKRHTFRSIARAIERWFA